MLRFYEAYKRTYRARLSFRRSTALEIAADALQELKHCHRAIISDDFDLVSACADPQLRTGVQNLPELLDRPSTWGLRPRRDMSAGRSEDTLLAGIDFFELLGECPNVKHLDLDYWDEHLERMTYPVGQAGSRFGYVKSMQNHHLTSVRCRVKVPDRLIEDGPSLASLPYEHELAFACMRNFSSMRDLTIEMSLSAPGGSVSDAEQDRSDDVSEYSSSTAATDDESTEDYLDLEYRPYSEGRPDGFTEELFKSFWCDIPLRFTPFPSLRAFTLSNVSFNASSLLCWLCSQEQLPGSAFSLTLQGTTVLKHLKPSIFFRSLQQLNVQISYDHQSTFYYPPASGWRTSSACNPPFTFCTISGKTLGEHYHGHREDTNTAQIIWDVEPPTQMPPCPPLSSQRHKPHSIDLIHRPTAFRYGPQDTINTPKGDIMSRQYYRLHRSGHKTAREWVNDVNEPVEQAFSDENFVLHMLTPLEPYHPDAYEYEAIVQHEFDRASSIEEEMWAEGQQQLLQHCETELLGTDVLENHRAALQGLEVGLNVPGVHGVKSQTLE